MKVLIVENEVYLAQSIASKLNEIGYACKHTTSVNDALENEQYDAVLLSTNLTGQNIYPIIEKYKESIIILLISYISNDTVSNPIKAGANDYIQKPFMIEELTRKLQHFQDFKSTKEENETYKNFLDHVFGKKIYKMPDKKLKFPIFLKTLTQNNADCFVFNYVRSIKKPFTFISLLEPNALAKIEKSKNEDLIYIVNLQSLKSCEKENFYDIIEHKNAFFSSTDVLDEPPFATISLSTNEIIHDDREMLSIESYTVCMIKTHQGKFTDTELSRKLGISRKSLWERRKKYGLIKKK